MIKTFKDFDKELKGQKIYEAEMIDDIHEENEDKHTKYDFIIPKLISSDKYLSKISKIVLRKLNNSNIGEFIAQPNIIYIDGVPGIYIYNIDNDTINIVICRNTMGKHLYSFKNFKDTGKNVADLVLSTTNSSGFSKMIDEIISYYSPDAIEEGWEVNVYGKCSSDDVNTILKIGDTSRQLIANLVKEFSVPNAAAAIFKGYVNHNKTYILLHDEIKEAFGAKKDLTEGFLKRVCGIFSIAMGKSNVQDQNVIKDAARVLDGLTNTKPIVTAEGDVPVDTEDETTQEMEKERLEEIREDTERYLLALDGIYNTTLDMCRYVKNGAVINEGDDYSWMETHALLITGIGGVGKSRNVNKALKEMNMVEGKDYYNVTSGGTSLGALYRKLYEFNGKLLLFDDSSELFKTAYQKSFWKNVLQSQGGEYDSPALVELPSNNVDDKKAFNSSTYNPVKLNRQERFWREIGKSTPEEKDKFYTSRRKEIKASIPVNAIGSISNDQITDIIDNEWEELEDKRKPAMPTRFIFNGVVIIISNHSYETLAKEVGVGDWGAIYSRTTAYDLHPKVESIWTSIKKDILYEKEKSESEVDNNSRLIPIGMEDEFIEEVERLLENPKYFYMCYRIITKNMRTVLFSDRRRDSWKYRLRDLMEMGKKSTSIK